MLEHSANVPIFAFVQHDLDPCPSLTAPHYMGCFRFQKIAFFCLNPLFHLSKYGSVHCTL